MENKEKIEKAYWEGYIQKQNEAVEICKQCKYRRKARKLEIMNKEALKKFKDIILQLAFEMGIAYGNIYKTIGLDNVIDFNDIAHANKCGAEWKLKGDMSDLPELFKIHKLKQNGIDELNKIVNNLEELKKITNQPYK